MISSLPIHKKNYGLKLDNHITEHLVLTLSMNGFELAGFSKSPYHITKISELSFEVAIKDFRELNNYLIQFINEQDLPRHTYKSIFINWIGQHFTLLPSSFYDSEKARDLLEFNIGKTPDESIITNDVEDIKLVYSIPTEIKNTLDKLFPSHNLKHVGYSTVKLFFNHFQLKNADLFLNIHNGQTEIVIKKDKKPLLYNVYNTLSDEDILYYLLFSVEQFNLNPANIRVAVAANRETSSELFTAIKKYIKNVEFAVSDKLIIRKEELEKLPHHFYFTTLNRLLCE